MRCRARKRIAEESEDKRRSTLPRLAANARRKMQRLLNETEEGRHKRMIARWEWRRKDHSLINKDDYSASLKEEGFSNLSDAEGKKRLSEMRPFERRLMRARAAETERIVDHEI